MREEALPSGISLGHIVLMRICLSSDSSTSIEGGSYLIDGNQADDRFDIVSKRIVAQRKMAEWKDVTMKLISYELMK